LIFQKNNKKESSTIKRTFDLEFGFFTIVNMPVWPYILLVNVFVFFDAIRRGYKKIVFERNLGSIILKKYLGKNKMEENEKFRTV
jgi:hypothetical protein